MNSNSVDVEDAQTPTMESTNVESQEPLLHDQTQTSSKLKQEASPLFPTGSERPYRDSTFTFLFLTAILTTFTFGIIAYTHTDTLNMDTKLRLSHFNFATNKCEITQQQTPEDPDSPSAIATLAAIGFFTSLALTIPLSLLLISLLRRYTRPMVLLSAAIAALCPLSISVSLFSWCLGVPEGCSVLGPVRVQLLYLICLPAWSVVLACQLRKNCTGSAVENGVQALSMATEVLKEYFVLQIVNPLLLVGWMVFVNGPIFMFIWYAFNVGEIVPDFDVVNDPLKGYGLATGSPCCREERPGWVYAYIILAIFTAFWVLWVSLSLPQMVMSSIVSQWYFAPTGSTTIGNIKRSLRNAYGPSFGTVCNQSTIVTCIVVGLVERFKEIGDQVSQSSHQSRILQRCFSWMSQFPKCHIGSGSIIASISGDSFWESSKKSYNLFIENSVPSIATTEEPFHHLAVQALTSLTFICTLLQTHVVYAVLQYFSNAVTASETNFAIAVLVCFPLTMIWLGSLFFCAINSVFSTTLVCYAMEKAVGEISKPEVCRALLAIPLSCPESEVTVAGSLASEVHLHPAKVASNADT